MTLQFDDGTQISIGPGDVVDLDPGHDAWTDGEEPCVLLDTGLKGYAKPIYTPSRKRAPAARAR